MCDEWSEGKQDVEEHRLWTTTVKFTCCMMIKFLVLRKIISFCSSSSCIGLEKFHFPQLKSRKPGRDPFPLQSFHAGRCIRPGTSLPKGTDAAFVLHHYKRSLIVNCMTMLKTLKYAWTLALLVALQLLLSTSVQGQFFQQFFGGNAGGSMFGNREQEPPPVSLAQPHSSSCSTLG